MNTDRVHETLCYAMLRELRLYRELTEQAAAALVTSERVDSVEAYTKTLDKFTQAKATAEHYIDVSPLDRQQKTILKRRYISGWSWGQIAKALGITNALVVRYHAQALKALTNGTEATECGT